MNINKKKVVVCTVIGLCGIALIIGVLSWNMKAIWMSALIDAQRADQQSTQLTNAIEMDREASQEPKLEVLSTNFRRDESGEYSFFEGEIKNISSESLKNVEAVVSFYDANDKFVTSESGLIEYLDLAPGQTSPFKVLSKYHARIVRGSVGFKNTVTDEKIVTRYPLDTSFRNETQTTLYRQLDGVRQNVLSFLSEDRERRNAIAWLKRN